MKGNLKKRKYFLIIVGFLSVLLVLLYVVLPYYTSYKIKQILKNDTNFPYKVSFEDFHLSIFRGNALMENIVITPDSSKVRQESVKIKRGKIKTIELESFSYSALYFKNKIYTQSIYIKEPEFELIQNQVEKDEDSDSKSFQLALKNSIHIKNITIEKAKASLIKENEDTANLKLYGFNLSINHIKATPETIQNKVPFTYENYNISYDSLYYKFSPIYFLKTDRAEVNNQGFLFDNINLSINEPMPEIQKMLAYQQDIFQIQNATVSAKNTDWGFDKNRLWVKLKELSIKDMNTRIFHSFIPPKGIHSSVFYSKKLRELPFDLSIDTLNVVNNKLSYVEQENFKQPEQSIYFKDLNATATSIVGGKFVQPDILTRIKVSTLFMDTSQTYVDWSFNVSNTNDAFSFKGNISNLKADKFNSFLVPLVRTEVSGEITNVVFDLNGNRFKCEGTMQMKYDNLKVFVLKKNLKKKNKFLTTVANLFVRKDRTNQKQIDIEYKREEDKSFFNFIWKSLFDGIKKIFI